MVNVIVSKELFSDGRFLDLIAALRSKREAYGLVLEAFVLAQRFWIPNKKLIPKTVFKTELDPLLLEVGLMEEVDDFIRLKGIEKHFAWWFKLNESTSKAGKASAEARKKKYGSSEPLRQDRPLKSLDSATNDQRTPFVPFVKNDENQGPPISKWDAPQSSESLGFVTNTDERLTNTHERYYYYYKKKNNNMLKNKEIVLTSGERVGLLVWLEKSYERYPRKIGKKKGIEALLRKLNTEKDLLNFASAVKNYSAQVISEGVEQKYVKHFSSFANCWEDYVELKTKEEVVCSL